MKDFDINYDLSGFEKPVKPDKTVKEKLISSQVNLNDDIKKVPALFSVLEGDNEIDIMTEGNISVIKGKAKSRKSFATAMIMGSYLRNSDSFNRFRGKTKKWAILFDTEQSRFYVKKSVERIYQISDEEEFSSRFMALALRPFNPAERLEMIEYVIYNVQNLGLIVIDGIRDLVKDINSAEEATNISSKLLKWTDDTQCHLCVIIHENKADGSARGHLGTELMNKAETILKVEKNEIQKNISKLSSEIVRGLDFEDIYFTVVDGIPVTCDKPTDLYNENRF